MTRLVIIILFIFSTCVLQAQNVGINATGADADPSATLDVVSTNCGLLIPRVALTGTSDVLTITNGNVNSLLVYNTATVSDVIPGYYYWSTTGNAWIRVEDENSASDDWRQMGNTATNSAINFVGTTDAQDLVFRTNNTAHMRIANATGNVLIGSNSDFGNNFSLQAADKMGVFRYGNNPVIAGYRSDGSIGTETQLSNEKRICALNANVFDGVAGHNTVTRINSESTENHTSTAMGTDLRFEITKNGIDSTRIALYVANNGRIGIGTTTPTVNLQVIGDDASTNQRVARFTNTASSKTFEIGLNSGTDNFAYITQSGCSGIVLDGGTGILAANMFVVRNNGRIGVGLASPLYRFEIPNINTANQGQARANAWVTYSDARIKSNFSDIEDAVQTIMQLQPKRYTQHSSKFEGGQLVLEGPTVETVGFVAQDLYKVLPELVHKPENENEDLWSVDYTKLTPVLVKAVQEQQVKLNDMQKILDKLKSQDKNINQRLAKLEAELK